MGRTRVRRGGGVLRNLLTPHHCGLDISFQHAEGNSDSHLLTSLFGQSQRLLVREGEPDLGRWQGVFLAEFDGPRSRTVRVAVHQA